MSKRILISLSIISAITALVIGGTIAYFSDTETSTGNTFTAGILNLQVGENEPTKYSFNFSNIAPGESTTTQTTIKNTGTIDAASMKITWKVTDSGGEMTEPECEAEGGNWNEASSTCSNNTPKDDISATTTVKIYYGKNENGNLVEVTSDVEKACVGEDKADGTLLLSELNECTFDFGKLKAGESKEFKMEFTLSSDAGNEYQGDQSSIEIIFNLSQ